VIEIASVVVKPVSEIFRYEDFVPQRFFPFFFELLLLLSRISLLMDFLSFRFALPSDYLDPALPVKSCFLSVPAGAA